MSRPDLNEREWGQIRYALMEHANANRMKACQIDQLPQDGETSAGRRYAKQSLIESAQESERLAKLLGDQ